MPLRAIEEARKTVYGIVSLSNEKELWLLGRRPTMSATEAGRNDRYPKTSERGRQCSILWCHPSKGIGRWVKG